MTVHTRHPVSLLLQELPKALLFLSLTTALDDEVVTLWSVAGGSSCAEVELHQLLPMTAAHVLPWECAVCRHSRARSSKLSDLIVSACKCYIVSGNIEGHASVHRPLRASLMGAQGRQGAWAGTTNTTLNRLW